MQCHQLTQVVEGTVIQANGRPNKDWLEDNHLPECSDTFTQFRMLLCYCGHVDFHNGMCQIVNGTLTGYGNLVFTNRTTMLCMHFIFEQTT